MKTFKKLLSIVLILSMISAFPVMASSGDNILSNKPITEFLARVSQNESGFSSWSTPNLIKAYDLYDLDGETVTAKLYYINNANDGYIITDCNGQILEFAKNRPAYDLYDGSVSIPIYKNGCYFVGKGGQIQLYSDGSIVVQTVTLRNIIDMDNNLQGSFMCIPTAIANIMWYWNKHGYTGLTASPFTTVQREVQDLMGTQSGSNSKIPSTVSSYASEKGYRGTATSLTASFSSIKSETNSGRPCLLGFAVGGGYSTAHMTVCCGTYVDSTANFSVVVDGHSSSNVYRVWGSYNDYVGKVVISN